MTVDKGSKRRYKGSNKKNSLYCEFMKNLTVVKSNKIVEAGYKLTLMEQLILLSCIAQIDSRAPLNAEMCFEIAASDLLKIKPTGAKNEYRDLKIASERLLSRIMTIDNPYPDEPRVKQLKTHWVSHVAYIPEEGKIRLGFSSEITPYLSELSREFTRYDLQYIGQMTSIYAIRLYELLMQWKATGKREIEIDWLRKQFQLENKYAAIKDLKKYVIDPAAQDINDHSNFNVSWTQRKTGRTVTHLLFTFSEKQPDKPKKRSTKPQNKPLDWRSYVEKKAKPGELWSEAEKRLRPLFEAEKRHSQPDRDTKTVDWVAEQEKASG